MFPIEVEKNLQLDLFTDSNAPELFSLVDSNRGHLSEWLGWLNHCKAPTDSLDFINKVNKDWEEQKALVLGIWLDRKLQGTVSFNSFDWENKVGGIGYWLATSAQGKGLASKACSCLIEFGAQQLRLESFTISCAIGNTRSQALAQRLGFNFQKVIKDAEWLYDHFVDHNRYVYTIS